MTTLMNETNKSEQRTVSVAAPFERLLARGYRYPLLLAIRDDDNAAAAIRMAAMLAGRGAEPIVLEAQELMVPLAGSPNAMIAFADQILGEDEQRKRVSGLRDLVAKNSGRIQNWPAFSVSGEASRCIVEEAAARNAELIVLGIHQHGFVESVLRENTATRVMGMSAVPVLGVRPTVNRTPRRMMVAVDFGRASAQAAHLAANLADGGGTVVLVHVTMPYPVVDEGDEGAALVHREGVSAAFEMLSAEISAGKRIRVERVLRTGDAATHLLSVATAMSPDLIAIASQRHHLLTRVMMGGTSRRLVRAGRWPVLVTPPLRS